LAYKNLDHLPEFQGVLTTTEFLASYIHGQVRKNIPPDLHLKIELNESHIASAAFED